MGVLRALMAATSPGVPISGASITPTNVPDPTQNVPYFQQLSVSGATGTFTWEITSGFLPSGLSLSSGGLISGTVTLLSPGTIRTVTFRATRAGGDYVERTIVLTLQ